MSDKKNYAACKLKQVFLERDDFLEPINKVESIITPLNRNNVDTDQIISKEFLKRIERTGFGKYLFYHWRYNSERN